MHFFELLAPRESGNMAMLFPICHSIQHRGNVVNADVFGVPDPQNPRYLRCFLDFFGTFRTRNAVNANGFEPLQDGAPKIAKLSYKWLYGRYNYS